MGRARTREKLLMSPLPVAAASQVVCTRTAGFFVVDCAQMSPAMQVAFAFFMYLNAYPFVVAMRQSSRRALEGGGGDDDDVGVRGPLAPPGGRRRQFAAGSRAIASTLAQNDLPWLLLAVVVITIAEDGPLRTTPEPRYLSVLGIIFEVMSAYGTVGLSFGYPGVSTALSAQFGSVSRLVIMAVAMGGRHRGIPAAVDASVFLPDLLQSQQRCRAPTFSVARVVEDGVLWAGDELSTVVAPAMAASVARAQGALHASVEAVERAVVQPATAGLRHGIDRMLGPTHVHGQSIAARNLESRQALATIATDTCSGAVPVETPSDGKVAESELQMCGVAASDAIPPVS